MRTTGSLIANNFRQVRDEISTIVRTQGRSLEDILIVAVSKKHAAPLMRQAFEHAGIRCFGENYVQEALAKKVQLDDLAIEWHLIGPLQTNKAKLVVGEFALIHSLDSERLARALNQRAAENNLVQRVLVQVNVANEDSKAGLNVNDGPKLVETIQSLPHLRLEGLMTMPPWVDDPELSRPHFARLRELAQDWERYLSAGHSLKQLSMGTTQDYVVAVEEGATLVRLGTVLFGPRD